MLTSEVLEEACDDPGGLCRYHGAMWGIISSAPEWIVNDYLLGFNQMLRKKYFKKMEREAAKAKGQ